MVTAWIPATSRPPCPAALIPASPLRDRSCSYIRRHTPGLSPRGPTTARCGPGERQSFLTGVRNALREELPSYMIPDRWSIVDELPVTSNGKTDLAALGEGERITEKGREPANETEEITAELFAESLDIEPEDVPVDADYFDMGGHSMAVIKLCALLRGELGVEVGVREFYGLRTVERVAEFVEARS